MWLFVFTVSDSDRILNKGKSGGSSTFQLAFHSVGGNETAGNGDPFVTWRFRLRAMVDDGSGPAQKEWVFTDSRAFPLRGQWQHIAVHLGPTNVKIYRDGVFAQRIAHSVNLTYIPDTSVPFALGNNAPNLGFERKLIGRVDELRFFRNELPNHELSSPFVTDTLMIDPGTPAPTPAGFTTTPTAAATTIARTTLTTTTTRPGTTTTAPRTTTANPSPATRTVDSVASTVSSVQVSSMDVSSATPNNNTMSSVAASASVGSADETQKGSGLSLQLSDTLTMSLAATQTAGDDSALIGGIVGGVVALLLCVGVIAFIVVRNRNAKANQHSADGGNPLQATRVDQPPNNSNYDRIDIPSSNYSERATVHSKTQNHYDALNANEL